MKMEANKSYILNEEKTSTMVGCNTSKGQVGCAMSQAPNSVICKDTSVPKNHSNKAIPVEALQYHRRKLTPQEQSRMVCNTSDYRCQDDIFTAATNGRIGSASILSSSQLESQPYFTSVGQQMQHQQQPVRHQQIHPLRNSVQLNQKSVCMSNSVFDCNEETLNCGERNESNERLIAASTQTQYYENQTINNCDAITALSSAVTIDSSGGALATTVASGQMMYTVHRVVTTAQIQTALGNTYASSSSVSSVVSALRNENDNLSTPTSMSTSLTTIPGNGIVGISGNIFSKIDDNSNARNSLIINAAGISDSQQSEGAGLLAKGAQKLNITSDHSRLQSASCNNSIIMNGINGSKSTSLIPRPLQNVIPTCVYLMSRIAVHMEIEGTSQCPTQVMLAAALGCEELGIANKLLAQSIFGLWMTSGLLDIQLKSHHRPFAVRVVWQSLLDKFSTGNPIEKKFDDPMIMLKRNVFFSKRDEEKIKDHRILELLYEEAKYNVLTGRYVMEASHALMLGGIQARIELGPYNSHTHTIGYLRENQLRFLPQHIARSTSWTWLPVSRKNSAEVKLLDQFKRVPLTATTKKLMRKYLEFCWALPFYGAAIFHGQVEQPVRGLMSLVSHKDVRVLVAVNERGIFIIDPLECTLLLGLRYEDFSWDFAKPSVNNDPDCQTCIFIQFDAMENGIHVSKLMQIFSKQASMIDALISHFTEQIRKLRASGKTGDQYDAEPYPIQNNGNGILCNKLWRLTLATFDEEGRCIGQTGSLSISY
ncbi:FERM domain-containing protein 8 isoform X1 [Zeugodacus cucurbitae]|uniref:FERM domain-containing protein 8 isoform X1 n=2 Tax=Zeugodacus cucurbitae TaxID=28588 RepID=UPI0023D8F147|nr:FERM domain-containing protein 8 isoform X1 [Zeugodacus cucurbitae]XP_054084165.1 FERM domain-containing protein 8 isoform X1 [Zeugodacus cucurbitae]